MGSWIPWSPLASHTGTHLCKQVFLVPIPDYVLVSRQPQTHILFSPWFGPPGPSSSQLTDLLLSLVSVPDSRLLQCFIPKPVILLDGYSGLVIVGDFALMYAPTQYACTPVPPAAGTQTSTHTGTQYRELLTQENSQKWNLKRKQDGALIRYRALPDTCTDQHLFICKQPF